MAQIIFPESSFFAEARARALPPPPEIRALNEATGHLKATRFNRPPPVLIPSLGLFVKYGGDVTHGEMQTQMAVRKMLLGQVPVPEVFGWAEDGNQLFIYMQLVEGQTVEDRWVNMEEGEREAVCKELRGMVGAWRSIEQESEDGQYIGSLGQKPLRDIFLRYPALTGPFSGADAVHQFQDICDIDISPEEIKIVFTHNDPSPSNIMLSLGPNPRVVAIVDWAQSGWYPDYWECCKSRSVARPPPYFSDALREEWHHKYVPTIIDRVDEEEVWNPFNYFVVTKGL